LNNATANASECLMMAFDW